jgi:Fe-Mn family superoxide dismutase
MKNALIQELSFGFMEHAYYLSINTEEKLHRFFFNVINWPKVAENYEAAFRKKIKSQF